MGIVMKAIIMKHVIMMVVIVVGGRLAMDTVTMIVIMSIVSMMAETVVGKMLTHITVLNAFVIIQYPVQNLHHQHHLAQPLQLQQVRPICLHKIYCLLYQCTIFSVLVLPFSPISIPYSRQ